jgi:hypothetical protein
MSGFSNSKYCFRRAGGTSPTLGLAQSFWALTQRDISIEKSLESACSEGFEYFEAGLREERLAQIAAILKTFPVKLIAQGWATTAEDAAAFLGRAAELHAIAINMHLGHAYMTVPEASDLIADVQLQAHNYGIPLLVETHRGRLTQDLFRMTEVLSLVPDTVITLDASHYLVAGETLGGSEDLFHAHINPLLARTGLIHGRISNGQSIQVPADGPFAFRSVTQSLWQQAMQLWLAEAPSDALLIFEPELGPPPYAFLNADGEEMFNRTAETLPLIQLARDTWAAAAANHARRADADWQLLTGPDNEQ